MGKYLLNILFIYLIVKTQIPLSQKSSILRIFWIVLPCIGYILHAKCYTVLSREAQQQQQQPPPLHPGSQRHQHLIPPSARASYTLNSKYLPCFSGMEVHNSKLFYALEYSTSIWVDDFQWYISKFNERATNI